jgi:hypothetical protein
MPTIREHRPVLNRIRILSNKLYIAATDTSCRKSSHCKCARLIARDKDMIDVEWQSANNRGSNNAHLADRSELALNFFEILHAILNMHSPLCCSRKLVTNALAGNLIGRISILTSQSIRFFHRVEKLTVVRVVDVVYDSKPDGKCMVWRYNSRIS